MVLNGGNMINKDIQQERSQLVVKQNDLIRKTKYDLSAQEQKLLLYMISKIRPEDSDLSDYEISLESLCDVCGIQKQAKTFHDFADILKKLSDNSFWADFGRGWGIHRWLNSVYFPETVGMAKEQLEHFVPRKVVVGFDPDLKPFLLYLKQNYTSYQLEYVLAMRSKYAIRLYEILKSYLYLGVYEPSVEELRKLLQVVGYDLFNNFKNRVLCPAVDEINRFTDICVDAIPVRDGKTVARIRFVLDNKDRDLDKAAERERNHVLEG